MVYTCKLAALNEITVCCVFPLFLVYNPVLNSHKQFLTQRKDTHSHSYLTTWSSLNMPWVAPPLTRTLPPLWFCSLDHNSSEKT